MLKGAERTVSIMLTVRFAPVSIMLTVRSAPVSIMLTVRSAPVSIIDALGKFGQFFNFFFHLATHD
jgi:hypothetical protein